MVSFYQMLPDRFRNLIDDHPQTIEDIWRWDCCLYDVSLQPLVADEFNLTRYYVGYYGPYSPKHIYPYYFWCPEAVEKLHAPATAVHPIFC